MIGGLVVRQLVKRAAGLPILFDQNLRALDNKAHQVHMLRQFSDAEAVLAALCPEPFIIYDGECPFCSRYVQWISLQQALGRVHLIDARTIDPMALNAIGRRYDLDSGMIFRIGRTTYWGADAVNALARLSESSGSIAKVYAWIFRRRPLARLLYPIMRLGRNFALRALGRRKIGADS
jgi:predicted DCC family thiol-disulfide oxidoreductase YuxK